MRLRQQWKARGKISHVPTHRDAYSQQLQDLASGAHKEQKEQQRQTSHGTHKTAWQTATATYNAYVAQMKQHQKCKPGENNFILSPDIYRAIQERYAPIAYKLYRYATQFLNGDENAFKKW